MRHGILYWVAFLGWMAVPSGNSALAAPYDLSYGGRLMESNGMPVSGPITIGVKFFRSEMNNDPVAGVTIPDFPGVVLQEGMFQLALSLTPAEFHLVFNGNDAVWIQMTDVTNNKVYPRQKFSAVPYALKVPVDGESLTYNVDGELTLAASGGAAGKFLKFDSPGVLVWDSLPGGGDMLRSSNLSDVANVATARSNLGLKGAAILDVGTTNGTVAAGDHNHVISSLTGAGALAGKSTVATGDIDNGAVTGVKIANDAITNTHIADGAIAQAKINGLGDAASKNVGGSIFDVAPGVHNHTASQVTDLGTAISGNATVSGLSSDVSALKSGTAGVDQTKLKSSGSAETVTVKAPASLGTGYTLTLPTSDGNADQVLKTDGAGNLSWINPATGTGDMLKANNLSDLTDVAAARSNLSLGALATKGTVGSADITDGTVSGTDIASSTITDANIAAGAAIAHSKIAGLGSAATKDVGAGAGDVAAGNHAHGDATTGAAGFMSAGDKVRLNAAVVTTDTDKVTSTMITDGTIVNADIASSAAIDGGKLADGSISLAKLSATMCAANQVLKMNGAGTALICAADATSAASYAAVSSDYTVTTADNDKLLDVTNQTTLTLPAAATAGAGFRVTVKRSGTHLVRLMPNGAENIDGQNLGVILVTPNSTVTLMSSGTSWVITSKDGIYGRSNSASDFLCGGAGDYCYNDTTAMAFGYAMTPSGKALEYARNVSNFSMWKELGGANTRILRPNGTDNWAMKLNPSGQGLSGTDFASWNSIVGRVCPTNVYLDDSNKFTTGNCLYYTAEPSQTLDANGTDDINGMDNWPSAKWYVGNVQVCSSKGMRLPTLFETTTTTITDLFYPTADGNPTFAQSNGVPALTSGTWTASVYTNAGSNYWTWSGASSASGYYGTSGLVRCVLP